MHYHSADLSRDVAGCIWSALIVPRPVFLIASRSAEGVNNIAPYSSIALVSVDPPIVSISFGSRNGQPKNTLLNILSSKHFSLNLTSNGLAELANISASGAGLVEDFDRLGLTARSFVRSPALFIAESPASIACELSQVVEISGSSCTLILARCTEASMQDQFVLDGIFDPTAANFIGSIGLEDYIAATGERFTLPQIRE